MRTHTTSVPVPVPVVSTCCSTGLATVGLKMLLNGNRTNMYEHVIAVHEHLWCPLCSVCAYRARVVQPLPCNFRSRGFTGAVTLLFQLVVQLDWQRLVWNFSSMKTAHRHVLVRGDATWTCLAHALQCLCVWGVCCPTLATQLVIDNSTTDKNNGMGTWFFYHCIYDLHRQSVVHIDAQTNHFKVNWDPRNSKLCSLEVKIPQIMSEMSLRHVPKHHDFK